MKENIYNNRAFEILIDSSYSKESHNLYCVVKSLFDYPNTFDHDEYPLLEGKLYSAAFAQLVSTYLKNMIDLYEHEDFNGFVEEMGFEEHAEELIKLAEKEKIEIDENLEYDEDEEHNPLDEIVWQVMQFYKKKIVKDIQELFVKKYKIINLFASVFEYEQDFASPFFELGGIEPFFIFEEEMGFKI